MAATELDKSLEADAELPSYSESGGYVNGGYESMKLEKLEVDDKSIVGSLRRDMMMLEGELKSIQAQQSLLLQTLSATLQLGAAATWADVTDRCGQLVSPEFSSQAPTSTDHHAELVKALALAREDALQADLESEQLADRLEQQSAQVNRLRGLLEKKQHLLDISSSQIQALDSKNQQLDKELLAMKSSEDTLQRQNVKQETRIDALTEAVKYMKESLRVI
jgi:hypothetical protein